MYFCVNDSIFASNEQQKVYIHKFVCMYVWIQGWIQTIYLRVSLYMRVYIRKFTRLYSLGVLNFNRHPREVADCWVTSLRVTVFM